MRTVCIVQSRMGSKRLPGKVLLPLNGHTVLGEVLTRCKRISGVDDVVCVTPDWVLTEEAARYDCYGYIGSEQDVLQRYYLAAQHFKADIIVRVTADCPLLSPELCGEVLKALKRTGADYASNILPRTFPKGFDCEVFRMDLLREADKHTPDHEREHVTPWMQRAPIRRVNVTSPWPLDGRLTLDTLDDYNVICAAFDEADRRLHAA